MVSSVSIIFQVQLYILSTKLRSQSTDASADNLASPFSLGLNNLYSYTIKKTSQYLLNNGIIEIVQRVRDAVTTHLIHWDIESKLSLEFLELISMISKIRNSMERDMNILISNCLGGECCDLLN